MVQINHHLEVSLKIQGLINQSIQIKESIKLTKIQIVNNSIKRDQIIMVAIEIQELNKVEDNQIIIVKESIMVIF